MAYRKTPFVNEEFYHLYNRGVERRDIFLEENDFRRCLETMSYYQFQLTPCRFSLISDISTNRINPANEKLVEIFCYCLMPNHFHLLVKQIKENGITKFISQWENSYTRYFNTKYGRVGPLFQGTFKSVHIGSEDQLMHLSRYIHLNPFVADLSDVPEKYPWSSYPEYLKLRKGGFTNLEVLNTQFPSAKEYKDFIMDYAEYAKSLGKIKDTLIDT